MSPRSGHTATLLKDGRVLVVGGVTDGGLLSTDIEMFDPATGTSMLVAQLAEPRRGHVAAALPDGTVLIAGGATTDGVVLQSAAIFDPETNTVAPLSTSLQARASNASATTLLDGRVLMAGGSNGAADLASAEIYERYSQVVRDGGNADERRPPGAFRRAAAAQRRRADRRRDVERRRAGGHRPVPAGGVPGSVLVWRGCSSPPTGAMAAPRAAAVAGPTSIEGYAFAASAGAVDGEVYRFATIKTDKDDYAPGELRGDHRVQDGRQTRK